MVIDVGGNCFFTSKRAALAEARRYATATIYRFEGVVMGDDAISTDREDAAYGRWQPLYLTLSLGEGCSDASWDLVRYAMSCEIVASREDYRWQN